MLLDTAAFGIFLADFSWNKYENLFGSSKLKRILSFILIVCFEMTFTHWPPHRHLACQEKQSDACWHPKTFAYAHSSSRVGIFFGGGGAGSVCFIFILFCKISRRICSLWRNLLAESHSYHSRYFASIAVPPTNQHTQIFRYAKQKTKTLIRAISQGLVPWKT